MRKLMSAFPIAVAILMIYPSVNAHAAPNADFTDVASYQGYTSVGTYQALGVKGAVVKLTEGTAYQSPTTATQIANAKSAGIQVSAYHYLQANNTYQATLEAAYFVARARALGLPSNTVMVADVEEYHIPDKTAVTQAFLTAVRNAGYLNTVVYTAGSWLNNQLNVATFGAKNIWVAAYPYEPRGKQWYTAYGAWQWTSTYTITGQNFDMSQDYTGRFTQQAKPNPTPPTPPQPSGVFDYAQWGSFRPWYTVNIRTGAGTGYPVIGSYAPGETLYYNHVFVRAGLVWARYLAYSGNYHYVCMGMMGGQEYGSRNGSGGGSIQHTYYTVRSGDSFWSIAHRYGVSLYTLAANNGKSINSTIYPGQTLLIR